MSKWSERVEAAKRQAEAARKMAEAARIRAEVAQERVESLRSRQRGDEVELPPVERPGVSASEEPVDAGDVEEETTGQQWKKRGALAAGVLLAAVIGVGALNSGETESSVAATPFAAVPTEVPTIRPTVRPSVTPDPANLAANIQERFDAALRSTRIETAVPVFGSEVPVDVSAELSEQGELTITANFDHADMTPETQQVVEVQFWDQVAQGSLVDDIEQQLIDQLETAGVGRALQRDYQFRRIVLDGYRVSATCARSEALAECVQQSLPPTPTPTSTPEPTITPLPTAVPPTAVQPTAAPVVVAQPVVADPPVPVPAAASPTLTPVPPPAAVYFANCTAARNAGAAPVYRGDPGYRSALDRDNDGVGCE